jgi:hypothetical protein
MPAPLAIVSSFWEGSDPGWTLGQIVDKWNALLLQASCDSIELNVYDDETKALIAGPTTIAVATAISDTLLYAGGIWTLDALGANFTYYLTHAYVFATVEPEGGKDYRAEYLITTTSGNGSGDIPVVHILTCKPMVQT